MKLNWGHYIVIAFSLFVMLILFMVYQSYMLDNDLVTEDYYAKELQYQDVIEKKQRARELEQNVIWFQDDLGLTVEFPKDVTEVEGSIYLFRPSDKELDYKIEISLDSTNAQVIPSEKLFSGKYNVQVDWGNSNEAYYTEGVVFINK